MLLKTICEHFSRTQQRILSGKDGLVGVQHAEFSEEGELSISMLTLQSFSETILVMPEFATLQVNQIRQMLLNAGDRFSLSDEIPLLLRETFACAFAGPEI